MKVNILGVKIDDVTMNEALNIVKEWLNGRGRKYIVTPNPEILVAAQTDNRLKSILNDADLSIPDGAGLKLSGKVKNTVAGTDLMEAICKLSAENGFTVGFLGGKDGVAEKCAECLQKKYPKLKVNFSGSGGEVDKNGKFSTNRSNNNIPPTDILFVAFGHIKQEKWIAGSLDKIPVKIAIGVGGAFNYLSGMVPRAPKLVRNLGFEWLFRLIIEPWRIKRQLALVKYVFYILRTK